MSLLSRLERVRNKDADIDRSADGASSSTAADDVTAGAGELAPEDSSAARVESASTAEAAGDKTVGGSAAGGGATIEDGDSSMFGRPTLTKISGGSEAGGVAAAGATAAGQAGEATPRPGGTEGGRLYQQHKYAIWDEVIASLDERLLKQPQRDAIRTALEKAVQEAERTKDLSFSSEERSWMVREFTQEVMGFGPLTPYLDDPSVSKIMINGAQDIVVERLGQAEHPAVYFRDDDHLLMLIKRIAEVVGGRIDQKVPLLDRPLPDGSRVRAKVPPFSPQPSLTIEKSAGNPFDLLRRQQAEQQRGDVQPYSQLRERIQQRLVRDLEGNAFSVSNQDRLRGQVEEMINNVIVEERVALSRAERASLVMEMLNEIVGLGPLEPMLNDPEVDEIMVNGPFQIYMERRGKLELSAHRFRDNNHIMQVIERMVAPLGRRVDEKSPMVDGRLRDGSRFNIILPPLALTGPTITVRKFARDPFSMTDLVNFGTLSREGAQFLQAAVEARLNVVVSGGTGSGKTTTLNVLSSFIPSDERVVTIEDAAELQMRQEHVIRLETRPPNIEGVGEITIRDLVRNALRMRPDRIIVGECRGAEALDMLQAMNTGHDGSLTTLHANNARDMVKRLETMVLMAGFDLPVRAIREQISMAIQLVAHQERMRDGVRRVVAVSEIFSMEGETVTMQDIFRFEQEYVDSNGRIHGRLQPTGLRPKHYEAMLDAGAKLPLDLFQPKPLEGGKMRGMDRVASR
jgi:pilus assembly protein CpaF